MMLVFFSTITVTKFRGTPSTGALNTQGMRKICDFRPKLPFMLETVQEAHGNYGSLIGSHR